MVEGGGTGRQDSVRQDGDGSSGGIDSAVHDLSESSSVSQSTSSSSSSSASETEKFEDARVYFYNAEKWVEYSAIFHSPQTLFVNPL